jgi:tetratricopeptide (TPR) repeat protein
VASGRLERTLRYNDGLGFSTHSGRRAGVVFSPDGRTLALAFLKNEVRLWDVASGRLEHTLRGHEKDTNHIAFSPDGRRVVTGSEDGTVRTWDPASGNALLTIRAHEKGVTALALSPRGNLVITGDGDGNVRTWNPETGRSGFTVQRHEKPVTALACSTDDRLFASADSGGALLIRDVMTGRTLRTMKGHTDAITSIAFQPGPRGARLASSSKDRSVKLWDVDTGDEMLTVALASGVLDVAFSPEGWRFATAREGDWLEFWDSALLAVEEDMATWTTFANRGFLRADVGRWEEALADFSRAIGLGADRWTIWAARGRAYAALGRDEEALADFEKATALFPGNAPTWLSLHALQAGSGRPDAEASYARAEVLCGVIRLELDKDWVYRRWSDFRTDAKAWQAVLDDYTTALIRKQNAWWVWRGRGLARAVLGRWLQAEADFTRALDANPTDAGAHTGRGLARMLLNRPDDAVVDLSAALQARPNDPGLYYLRGVALSLGQSELTADSATRDRVGADLTRSIELGYDGGAVRSLRGWANSRPGHWDMAVADLVEATGRDPDNRTRWARRALAHFSAAQWDQAVACCTKYLALRELLHEPFHDQDLWHLRGRARAAQGQYREAVADYDGALKLVPHDAVVWLSRHRAHVALGLRDEADADYARAATEAGASAPGGNQTWEGRTKASTPDVRWGEAEVELTRAIEAGGPGGRTWRARALTRAATGRWGEAELDFSKALEVDPRDSKSYSGRARARAERGDWGFAVDDWARAAELDPSDGPSCHALGLAYNRGWHYEQAVAEFLRAIARGTDSWAVRAGRGWALRQLGRWERAAEDYKAATSVKKDDAGLWFSRGFIHAQLEQWDDTVTCCTTALALKKNDARTLHLRGRANTALGRDGDAKRDFRESADLVTHSDALWLSRYLLYAKLKERKNAGICYEWAANNVNFDVKTRWEERQCRRLEGEAEDLRAILDDFSRVLRPGGSATGWALRGRALANAALGSWAAAADDFTEAIRIEPAAVDGWVGLGRARAELGRWDLALDAWEHAVRLAYNGPDISCCIGLAFAHLGRPNDAVRSFSRAIGLGAGGWPAYEGRALALRALGRMAEAEADFSQVIRISGGDWRAFAHRGDVRAFRADWTGAADDLTRGVELTADQPEVWRHLALAHLAQGRAVDYRKTCDNMIDRFGRTNDAHVTQTLVQTCVLAPGALAHPEQLPRLAQSVTRTRTHDTLALLGAALFRAGRFEKAVQRIDEAIASDGDRKGTVSDWLFLALTHHRLGHLAEARNSLREAGAFDRIVEEWAEQAVQDDPGIALGARLLRDEAEALIHARERKLDDRPR